MNVSTSVEIHLGFFKGKIYKCKHFYSFQTNYSSDEMSWKMNYIKCKLYP